MIEAIAAVDKNLGLGYQGQMLAHIPEDLQFFKHKTVGKIVVMGRKTYKSLPIRPLPNRLNIVITSQASEFGLHYIAENLIYVNR